MTHETVHCNNDPFYLPAVYHFVVRSVKMLAGQVKSLIYSRKFLSDEPCKCLDISFNERHYPVVYKFYNSSFFLLTISFCFRKPDSFSSVLVKSEPGRSHYEH